jgi:hypothetical protein
MLCTRFKFKKGNDLSITFLFYFNVDYGYKTTEAVDSCQFLFMVEESESTWNHQID